METWDAIRSRRNVRQFDDRPIAPEDLNRILEAGRRSPSSTNEQVWDFVVCVERDRLRALAKVWQGAWHVATSAATIALVAPVEPNPATGGFLLYDLGQATMSVMIAAADLGIGSAHAAVLDQALAREILGFPEDRRCWVMIALGYPGDRPLRPILDPKRRPFDDVVHRERW